MEGGRNLAGFGEKDFCEGYSGQFLQGSRCSVGLVEEVQGVGEEGVIPAGVLVMMVWFMLVMAYSLY